MQTLALLVLFVLVHCAIAGRVERTWVSGPIAMAAVCTIVLSILPPIPGPRLVVYGRGSRVS
jgi:hypothetical protein